MKKISIAILVSGIVVPSVLFAQTDIDALRYSQPALFGTARYVSMGGAFGALGGDFSSLSDNPAGIGLYRKSEFTFTPDFNSEKTTSSFIGQQGTDNKFNFNIGDIGLVFSKRLNNDAGEGWKNINFAIGYNEQNNFNARSDYQGFNANNSFLDAITQQINSYNNGAGKQVSDLNPFDESLAYQSFLINPNSPSDSTHFYNVRPVSGEMQRRISQSNGSSGEIVIALGSNYSNRFYIGGTLGIDFLHYNENTTYEEINTTNDPTGFNYFNYNTNVTTSGVGVNFKFGAIFKATDWLRFGAAIHTPTYYSMHDDYNSSIDALTDSGHVFAQSPNGSYDYNLTTPLKAIGSVAVVLGKMGLVSAEYEYMDYSEMKLTSSDPTAFADVNQTIQQKYTATGNIKVGTEWRLGGVYSVRAGYAMFGSPFASGQAVTGADGSIDSYSVGFGIRDAGFFVDMGYAYTISHNYLQEYSLLNPNSESGLVVPGATNKVVNNNFMVTFGFRF